MSNTQKDSLATGEQSDKDLIIKSLKAEIGKLKETISDLEDSLEDADGYSNLQYSFMATEEIKYETTGNLIDEDLMDALIDALDHRTTLEVISLLK